MITKPPIVSPGYSPASRSHRTGGTLPCYTHYDTRHRAHSAPPTTKSTIARPPVLCYIRLYKQYEVVALDSSTGAAPLAVGLEDEAQRPGVGQGRAKQELATGAQRRRLASGELASADRGAEGAA